MNKTEVMGSGSGAGGSLTSLSGRTRRGVIVIPCLRQSLEQEPDATTGQQAAGNIDPGKPCKAVQGTSAVREEILGRDQAAETRRHIGHCALKRHEGGALMGAGMAAVMASVVLDRAELSAMKRVNSR